MTILTTDELAAHFKVSKRVIETHRNRMPGAFKAGGQWRYDLDLVLAYIAKTGSMFKPERALVRAEGGHRPLAGKHISPRHGSREAGRKEGTHER